MEPIYSGNTFRAIGRRHITPYDLYLIFFSGQKMVEIIIFFFSVRFKTETKLYITTCAHDSIFFYQWQTKTQYCI